MTRHRNNKVDRYILGKRIVARRKTLGLTQADLATKAGVASGGISNYESGKTYPTSPMLQKLANALNTTVEVLEAEATEAELAALEKYKAEIQAEEQEIQATVQRTLPVPEDPSIKSVTPETQFQRKGCIPEIPDGQMSFLEDLPKKEATTLLPVPRTLADNFDRVAKERGRKAADVLRDFMQTYVLNSKATGRIIPSYTIDELAEIWHVPKRALEDYRRAGRIDTFRLGGKRYVTLEAVDDFVRRGGMSGGLLKRKD